MKYETNRFFLNGIQKWQMTLLTSILILISSCTSDEPAPPLTVTTDTPTNITATQAQLGGNVTKDGGHTVTDRGVCVSLQANPTIDDPINDQVLHIGTGVGTFTDTFDGFPPSTVVHVRAFATNSSGTVYGEDKMFTTLAAASSTLVVTTSTPTAITSTQALLGGNVTSSASV